MKPAPVSGRSTPVVKRSVRNALAGLGALFVALGTVIGLPTAASAGPEDDVIRDLQVDIKIDSAGVAHIQETYQWDFGTRQGLGFYREILTAMGWGPDPSKMRLFEVSNYQVHSPSGAPAEVWVEATTSTGIKLSVGAPDGSSDRRSGVQTYVLSYEVNGAINAIRDQPGVNDQDELYYNLFSTVNNTFDSVTVRVSGPADVVDVACYQGPFGSTDRCDSYTSSGNTATFTGHLKSGDAFSFMAAYPPGTFTNPGPILVPNTVGKPEDFDPNHDPAAAAWANAKPWLIGGGVGWTGLMGALAFWRVRKGRDKVYGGLPPGLVPPHGMESQYPSMNMGKEPPVTVRFTPPDGLRPAEGDVLATETARNEAFSATLIDLAVRGYLTIADTGKNFFGKVDNWELTLNPNAPGPETLTPYEQRLMRSFFKKGSRVRTKELRGEFAGELSKFRQELVKKSDSEKWYQRDGLVTSSGAGSIIGSLGMGIIAFLFVFGTSGDVFQQLLAGETIAIPVIAIAFAVITFILVMVATSKAAHGRTAKGRALYEQVRGFREYLSTAEAHQIKWELNEDIFSKYLPWAVSFGVADRWTRVFQELAAAGVYTYQPTWYIGYGGHDFASSIGNLGNSISNFATAGMSSLAYTPGSSGGSGSFGGGGGFSGGGGGGGSVGGR